MSTANPDIEKLSKFSPTTEEELRRIVTKFGMECSPEDPLPASILSSYLDTLLPVWVDIVNLSLSVGSMASLKSAVILPLIKELTTLKVESFAGINFRGDKLSRTPMVKINFRGDKLLRMKEILTEFSYFHAIFSVF